MRPAKIVAPAAFLLATLVSPLEADDLHIRTLSTRPGTISGGDVLIGIDAPQSASPDRIIVKLNNQNVTSLFRLDPEARTYTGLVTGLKIGSNILDVYTDGRAGGKPAKRLTFTNHPIVGIQPSSSFPDSLSFLVPAVDCLLLENALWPVCTARIPTMVSRGGRSTTSVCSTAWPRSRPAGSRRSNLSS